METLYSLLNNKLLDLSYFTAAILITPIFFFWKERRLWVFENRVLMGIFGTKRDEVTMEWRKLHNEELNDLYFSHNIIRVIKSRRMR